MVADETCRLALRSGDIGDKMKLPAILILATLSMDSAHAAAPCWLSAVACNAGSSTPGLPGNYAPIVVARQIPEPASFWILLTGCGVLVGMLADRRKNRKS